MGCYVTLMLLFFGWSLSSCNVPPRTYYYINQPMTWFQAQNHCREHYTDLATFESHDDISMLEPTISGQWAWIGLNDDPKSWKENLGKDHNSWRWSVSGETGKTTYKAWASGEPTLSTGNEACVVMNANGTWADTICTNEYDFVCYTVTNQSEKVYHFIPTVKSWNSAQQYCRQNYTDLAMIENAEENNLVSSKPGGLRWIGLYRVPWLWSDGSHSSFKNWYRWYRPNKDNLNCVVEWVKFHDWSDRDCSESLPFICHQVTTLKTTVRMQIKTDADMTDPAVIEHFLQEIRDRLTNLGWTDFKLQWKNLSSNQTKET